MFEDNYEINGETGCHVWQRAKQSRGYGVTWFKGKVRLAHRVAWFQLHGTWPPMLDHICNNNACVNPLHLNPRGDEQTETKRRGWRAANARRRNSHDYSIGGE